MVKVYGERGVALAQEARADTVLEALMKVVESAPSALENKGALAIRMRAIVPDLTDVEIASALEDLISRANATLEMLRRSQSASR